MMKLAIHGGRPVREKPFPAHNTIGEEEKSAVNRVLDSGVLSKFLGCWHADFYGGTEVHALEQEWATHFGAKHAIAVNSCTSGLFCAVGAIGVEPGDEIIVTPYTMSATATAPLIFNAVPVFADIEAAHFCLDPEAVREKITPRTKAIMVVDLFGQPYDTAGINALASEHGLFVIEDTAQALGAMQAGKFAGTLGHIGVYSLNYHKHIHCGEGGIIVTDDDDLAERMRLIRNHAEAVVEAKGVSNLINMIGFNFRLPEMEAAVARCQLRKLPALLQKRQENSGYLSERLAQIPAITPPRVRHNCTHAYYVHACRFNEDMAGVSRNAFVDAVKAELPPFARREAEGVKLSYGYVKPLYLQPLFQQQIAYGSKGFPFRSSEFTSTVDYRKGSCPTTERLHEQELFIHEFMVPSMTVKDLEDVVTAFEKVWENRTQLQERR
jgi:dTDP-4-amino-4,6-dideoxygalactose transaminase